jgi:uncharacterized damage-inducible protein DinB
VPRAPTALRSFYEGWEQYQELLVKSVSGLTETDLHLQAAPHLRPAWLLAAHIIAGRVYWFHRVLGEGDSALAPMQAWDDDGQPMRTADELAHGLKATSAFVQDCLERWTLAMLADTLPPYRGVTRTRQWVIWHLMEHDLHHGGELFLTLGMHGIPTPDI